MEKMIDLRDLLKHEIVDLYSVESQIIDALPDMIEKAINPSLKKALSDHLAVTEEQKKRLDRIKEMIIEQSDAENKNEPGFFARIFGGNGEEKCKGMEGILEEGKKMLGTDMTPEVQDAAIIAACQKVEHYEICGYGTAVAYARELRLAEITDLLGRSLEEEYDADDSLTFLAVGHLNLEAEFAGGDMGDDEPLKAPKNNNNTGRRSANRSGKSSGNAAPKKSAPAKAEAKKSAAPAKRPAPAKNSGSSARGGSGKSAPGKGMNGKKSNSGSQATSKRTAPSKEAAAKGGRNSGGGKTSGRGGSSSSQQSGGRSAAKKSSGRGSSASSGERGGASSARGKGASAPKKGAASSSRGGSITRGKSASAAPKKSAGGGRSAQKSAPKKAAGKSGGRSQSAAKKGGSKGNRR